MTNGSGKTSGFEGGGKCPAGEHTSCKIRTYLRNLGGVGEDERGKKKKDALLGMTKNDAGREIVRRGPERREE